MVAISRVITAATAGLLARSTSPTSSSSPMSTTSSTLATSSTSSDFSNSMTDSFHLTTSAARPSPTASSPSPPLTTYIPPAMYPVQNPVHAVSPIRPPGGPTWHTCPAEPEYIEPKVACYKNCSVWPMEYGRFRIDQRRHGWLYSHFESRAWLIQPDLDPGFLGVMGKGMAMSGVWKSWKDVGRRLVAEHEWLEGAKKYARFAREDLAMRYGVSIYPEPGVWPPFHGEELGLRDGPADGHDENQWRFENALRTYLDRLPTATLLEYMNSLPGGDLMSFRNMLGPFSRRQVWKADMTRMSAGYMSGTVMKMMGLFPNEDGPATLPRPDVTTPDYCVTRSRYNMEMDQYHGARALMTTIAEMHPTGRGRGLSGADFGLVSAAMEELRHRFVDQMNSERMTDYLVMEKIKEEATLQVSDVLDDMTQYWEKCRRDDRTTPFDQRYYPLQEVGLHLQPDLLLPKDFYPCVDQTWKCSKQDEQHMLLPREDLDMISALRILETFMRERYHIMMDDVLKTMWSIKDNTMEEETIVFQKIACLRGKLGRWQTGEEHGLLCAATCGGDRPDPNCEKYIDLDHDGKNDRTMEHCENGLNYLVKNFWYSPFTILGHSSMWFKDYCEQEKKLPDWAVPPNWKGGKAKNKCPYPGQEC